MSMLNFPTVSCIFLMYFFGDKLWKCMCLVCLACPWDVLWKGITLAIQSLLVEKWLLNGTFNLRFAVVLLAAAAVVVFFLGPFFTLSTNIAILMIFDTGSKRTPKAVSESDNKLIVLTLKNLKQQQNKKLNTGFKHWKKMFEV